MKKDGYAIKLVRFCLCLFLTFLSFQPKAYPAASSHFDTVQKIYIGYYHRPADPAGLIYWAERLDGTGGNLSEMIEAFANSAESQALYGTITGDAISGVVNDIYLALLDRNAEPGGLGYYVDGFNSGRFTAATIMLDVLYGTQNEDLQTINNKLAAAKLFTETIDPGLDGIDFQATYAGDGDVVAGRNFLALYATSANVPTQAETTAYVKANIADPGDPIRSLLEGAVTYSGSYPTPTGVSFTDKDGRHVTVTAFPGHVQLFFDSATTDAAATKIIQDLGGNVLSKIPNMQYYMAGVTPGTASSFIAAALRSPAVESAAPHIVAEIKQDPTAYCSGNDADVRCVPPNLQDLNDSYCGAHPSDEFLCKAVPLNVSPGIVVIDTNFTDGHGYEVSETAKRGGGGIGGFVALPVKHCTKEECGFDGEAQSTDMMVKAIAASTEGNRLFNPGKSLIVNLSQNGVEGPSDADTLANIEGFLSVLLQGMGKIPADIRNNGLAVNIAIGNENLDLTEALVNIRKDAELADVMRKHVLLVGTTLPYADPRYGSNHVTGEDPDVAVSNNLEARDGTSFAAPAASAIQHQLIGRGYTLEQALQRCKSADDRHGQLTLENAIAASSGGATYTGTFSGSSTETIDCAQWRDDITATVTIAVAGSGTLIDPYTGTMSLDGSGVVSLLYSHCTPAADPGGAMALDGIGAVSGSQSRVEASSSGAVGAAPFTASFTGGTFSGSELTGTLTFDADGLDAPIVSTITLRL